MRSRPPSPEHAEAVSRRLAALSTEMALVRNEAPSGHAPTRVRGDQWGNPGFPGAEPSPPFPEPIAVPDPGRHASRRSLRLPGTRGIGLGPAHLAVVAAVVALALGAAAWLALRHAPDPVPVGEVAPAEGPLVTSDPAPETTGPTTGAAPGAASGPVGAEVSGEVTVDVAGKVRRPGIAVLPAGSRVVDALEAAGGARRGVDLTALNLARPLTDGEQILVGVTVPAGVAGSLGTPGSGAADPGAALVSLNGADQATLETLPGVGPVTATAIIEWREANGGFTAVDELVEVDGIGEATLADLAPLVTL